jgi:ATP-dependent RNA helicase DeaD
MASFNDLGLREELSSALEEQGIERPTALQAALVPVLRREGNVVARAGSGSGKTLAYGLGILDRLEAREPSEEEGAEAPSGTRLLVLVPTAERAESTALTLVPLGHAAGLTVAASGRGWGTGAGEAEVLVATAAEVLTSVRASGVKLETLEALVVDGASEIETVGGWEAVESLFDLVPRDAQRVLLTGETTPAIDDLIDRRIKRALRYPPTPAVADGSDTPTVTGVVGYVVVSEREKLEVVAGVLGGERGEEAPPTVVCSTDERAAQVAEALALRGFVAGDLEDEGIDVAVVGLAAAMEDEDAGDRSTVISMDVPPDEAALRALHAGEITGFVLLLPRERPHLRQIAARAGLEARPAGLTGDAPAGRDEVRAFRDTLRRALRQEDLGAQMLLLEPLFEDFTPAEVAAAATALLRRKAPAAEAPAAAATAATAERAPREPRKTERDSTAGSAPAAYARLYVGVGERDGVRAGDLVGAIAGESDIPGSKVGKIDIRDTFSIVEVPADLAEHIISSVNGTTIKGRAARVDHDRGNAGRKPGGPRAGGDRGAPRGAPRGGPRSGPPRGGAGGGADRPRRTFRPPPRDSE